MMHGFAALLDRLRGAGVLAIGVLIACAAFYFSALAPVEQQLASQRAAQARLRTPAGAAGPAASRPAELQRYYGFFPSVDAVGDELERIHRLGRSGGLELARGEYRLERRSGGLLAYRATLPLRGNYAQIRQFLAALLAEVPVASVDALRFERKKASETQLEAQLRFTLFVRPTGES